MKRTLVCLLSCAGLLAAAPPVQAQARDSVRDRCINSKAFIPEVVGGLPETVSSAEAAATISGPPPGGDHNVGDVWDWYVWRLAGFPVADVKPGTIRGKSDHAYVVVENDAWDAGLVDDAKVATVLDHFENVNFTATRTGGIYDLNVEAFGDPPLGLDDDPRVYLFYYDFDVSSDGYFWAFDASPDGSTPPFGSNECEVVYLNCGPDAGVDHDPAGPYMIGVAAHELEHLIHYAYDDNEENWIDEGLAEYAMFRYGADDPGWIASFLADPDVELIPASGFAHYGAVWFFTVYLAGHYGDTLLSKSLVLEPANGISGIDNTLGSLGYADTFSEVYRNWIVANLVDDNSLASGEYGYPEFEFAPINHVATHDAYPVPPATASVTLWAADYVSLQGYAAINAFFDGRDSDHFVVHSVSLDTDLVLPPMVETWTLDALQDGSFEASSSSGYEQAVLIVGALSPSASSALYTYSVDESAVPTPVLLKAVKAGPDPTTDLELSWTGGAAPYDLYRSLAKTDIDSPGSLASPGVMTPLLLEGELENLVYYAIEGM